MLGLTLPRGMERWDDVEVSLGASFCGGATGPSEREEPAMPAVTVDDLLTLPRLPVPDPATAVVRPVSQ